MNGESIIQGELTQKEKDKYPILTHIYGIQKDGTDAPVSGQQWRRRHGEQTCGHSGKERVGGTERSIETYALPYVKLDSQWAFAV